MSVKTVLARYAERCINFLADACEELASRRFYRFPLGRRPWADPSVYLGLWEKAKSEAYPVVDEYERETGYAIDPDWFHRLALLTQVVVKDLDICYQHGRLLYATLSQYCAHHRGTMVSVLETGTARGFSALCMAKALEDAGCCGRIVTFDVLPHTARMFWNCVADAEGPCTREELLTQYRPLIEKYIVFHQGDTKRELKKIEIPRVNFAFLDGEHTYEYVMHEFRYVRTRQMRGDMIFFDDYTPDLFPGVVRAVNEICGSHGYEKRIIRLTVQRGYAIAVRR